MLFYRIFFILVIYIENLSAYKEIVLVVLMLSYKLLMNYRRLTLKKKIRAICTLSNVLQDVLQDVLLNLIYKD